MLKHRLRLGTFLGIGVFVHWTFALLIAYVAFSAFQSVENVDPGVQAVDQDSTVPASVEDVDQYSSSRPPENRLFIVAYSVLQLIAVFFCVTLHEYGHALAARRYGIETVDITLLPIGGVARLERMPRQPIRELVVAVAGPAVNVVIVALMLLGFWIIDPQLNVIVIVIIMIGYMFSVPLETLAGVIWQVTGGAEIVHEGEVVHQALMEPSLTGFALTMLMVNALLVLFNMIPAFPMDGGRVFRSIAAMFLDYRTATVLASRVGIAVGILMAIVAIRLGSPMPVLIAMFIGYAGLNEARQVEVTEAVRGLRVRDVMIHNPMSISMNASVDEIRHAWRHCSVGTLPVTAVGKTVVGVLTLKSFSKAIEAPDAQCKTAGQFADHNAPNISEDASLEDIILSVGRSYAQVAVVDGQHHLVGLLDFGSVTTRGKFARQSAGEDSIEEPEKPFDAAI